MDVTPRIGLDAAISHHASGSVTYQVGSDTRTGRVRFWSFQMGVSPAFQYCTHVAIENCTLGALT